MDNNVIRLDLQLDNVTAGEGKQLCTSECQYLEELANWSWKSGASTLCSVVSKKNVGERLKLLKCGKTTWNFPSKSCYDVNLAGRFWGHKKLFSSS